MSFDLVISPARWYNQIHLLGSKAARGWEKGSLPRLGRRAVGRTAGEMGVRTSRARAPGQENTVRDPDMGNLEES